MRMALLVLIAALAVVQSNAASGAADVDEPNGQQPFPHDLLKSIINEPVSGASASISATRAASLYPELEKDELCLKAETCRGDGEAHRYLLNANGKLLSVLTGMGQGHLDAPALL